MTPKAAILIILVLAGAYFLFFNTETWIGFYYPDKNNLTEHVQSPELKSLEECRSWVKFTQIPLHNPSGSGYDYECGKNCRFDNGSGFYICQETLN